MFSLLLISVKYILAPFLLSWKVLRIKYYDQCDLCDQNYGDLTLTLRLISFIENEGLESSCSWVIGYI